MSDSWPFGQRCDTRSDASLPFAKRICKQLFSVEWVSSPDFHKVEAPSLGQIDCSLQVEVNDPAGRYSPFGGMGGPIMNEFASPAATLASVSLNARRGYDDDEDGAGAEGSGIAFARGSITFRPAAALRQRQSQGMEAKMLGMMGTYQQSSADELRELSQQSKCAATPCFQMRTPGRPLTGRPLCA